MHIKTILRILGSLLMLLAAIMAGCAAVALFFGGYDFFAFIASALITVLVGLWLLYFGKGGEKKYSRRDSYLTITLSWLMFALVGTLPLLLSGLITNFTDAFFESMSGFTTTGCTVIGDTEAIPRATLLWRCLSQWLGGLGIVFFTVAVLPMFGFSGVQLFAAEATGYAKKKSQPSRGCQCPLDTYCLCHPHRSLYSQFVALRNASFRGYLPRTNYHFHGWLLHP